jgi:cytochrome P450 family 2 subfamily J
MANYNACHRSADYWAEPDILNPDHFLEEGKLINDKEGFLPYGSGPRVCPSAEFADMQLFLMLSNILTTFTLSLTEGDTERSSRRGLRC